jgi:hypothetical protein
MAAVAISSLLALAWVASRLTQQAGKIAGIADAQGKFMERVGESFEQAMKATTNGWDLAMKEREAASKQMWDLSTGEGARRLMVSLDAHIEDMRKRFGFDDAEIAALLRQSMRMPEVAK